MIHIQLILTTGHLLLGAPLLLIAVRIYAVLANIALLLWTRTPSIMPVTCSIISNPDITFTAVIRHALTAAYLCIQLYFYFTLIPESLKVNLFLFIHVI